MISKKIEKIIFLLAFVLCIVSCKTEKIDFAVIKLEEKQESVIEIVTNAINFIYISLT